MNKALNNPQKTPKPLSKTTTIGLMVLFVGPMIMAGILYYLEPQLKLSSHQVGTLLSPPIPAAALNLNPDPIPTTPWRLLYYTPNCNNIALCSVSLEKMERLRAGLGKNASRVSTYLVSQMPPPQKISRYKHGNILPASNNYLHHYNPYKQADF